MQSMGIPLSKVLRSHIVKKVRNVTQKAFSEKYLLLTNVSISVCLSGVGDVIEQQYEMTTGVLDKYSLSRTHHMSLSGMTIGAMCHFWYRYLDRAMPGRTIATVLKKVLVDQVVASPIFISTFFLTVGYLENASWKDIREEFKHKAWKLYAAEWVIWPPAQIVNFYVLPTRYRVLYDNTISLGYDVYTSHVKHHSKQNGNKDREDDD